MTRAHLPNRRGGTTLDVKHGEHRFTVTIGEYEDHSPGEVFVVPLGNAGKGSDMEALVRDAGLLLSFNLQFGVRPEALRHAVTRNEDGSPVSLIGAVLDAMVNG